MHKFNEAGCFRRYATLDEDHECDYMCWVVLHKHKLTRANTTRAEQASSQVGIDTQVHPFACTIRLQHSSAHVGGNTQVHTLAHTGRRPHSSAQFGRVTQVLKLARVILLQHSSAHVDMVKYGPHAV